MILLCNIMLIWAGSVIKASPGAEEQNQEKGNVDLYDEMVARWMRVSYQRGGQDVG